MSTRGLYYVQCQLARGNTSQVAWIPEKFATVGRHLELKEDGRWDIGWQVVSTASRQSEDYIKEYGRDYANTRKATDV